MLLLMSFLDVIRAAGGKYFWYLCVLQDFCFGVRETSLSQLKQRRTKGQGCILRRGEELILGTGKLSKAQACYPTCFHLCFSLLGCFFPFPAEQFPLMLSPHNRQFMFRFPSSLLYCLGFVDGRINQSFDMYCVLDVISTHQFQIRSPLVAFYTFSVSNGFILPSGSHGYTLCTHVYHCSQKH